MSRRVLSRSGRLCAAWPESNAPVCSWKRDGKYVFCEAHKTFFMLVPCPSTSRVAVTLSEWRGEPYFCRLTTKKTLGKSGRYIDRMGL